MRRKGKKIEMKWRNWQEEMEREREVGGGEKIRYKVTVRTEGKSE